MNILHTLLLLLVLVLITLTMLLAGAAGVGVLLHRLMPSVGLGPAILTGVVGLSVSIHFVLRIFAEARSVGEELTEVELEEVVATIRRPSRRRRARP